MKNIFIEGIQGMGKSTLLQAIANKNPDYHVCLEGDYSPIELAWCTWMTEEEYTAKLQQYSSIRRDIEEHTVREDDHYVVSYTRIITDIPNFHKDLEQYEIYNGRKSLQDFEQIILSRYQQFRNTEYLFECSFLQNIVESLILFYQLSDDEIVDFYHKLFQSIDKEHFILLYLYSDQLEDSTKLIQKERADHQGNELWYSLMLQYLVHSPYGKEHGYQGFEDMILHFRHRQQLELRIINEVIRDRGIILPAKQWKLDEVINMINNLD